MVDTLASLNDLSDRVSEEWEKTEEKEMEGEGGKEEGIEKSEVEGWRRKNGSQESSALFHLECGFVCRLGKKKKIPTWCFL